MLAAKRKSRLHRKVLRHTPGSQGQEAGEAPGNHDHGSKPGDEKGLLSV